MPKLNPDRSKAKIVLKQDDFNAFLTGMCLNQVDLSEILHIDQASISRISRGLIGPSNYFIASLLATCEAPFDLFFQITTV